jgi:hypothetical protein
MDFIARKISRIAKDLLLYSILTAALSGCCLAWYYIPVPEKALVSILNLKESVFAGRIVLAVHFLSALIILPLCLVFAGAALIIKIQYRIKLRLIIPPIIILTLGISGKITGLMLSADQQAVSVLKKVFLTSPAPGALLPPLIDDFSMVFFRTFLFHALIIPGLILYLLYLLLKYSKTILNSDNRNPVVRHSTRFAAYVTVLIIIAYFFRNIV